MKAQESLNVSRIFDEESLSVETYNTSMSIENTVDFNDLILNIIG